MSIHVLAGLLDEKLIRILSLFLKSPEKQFSLTQVCKLSRVNNATTFRTLNKLVKEELIDLIVIGKARTYQLSSSQRAQTLAGLLHKGENTKDHLATFVERAKQIPGIEKIILDSKTASSAKVIIISNKVVKSYLANIIRKIKEEDKFSIAFAELGVDQYNDLKKTSLFDTSKRELFSTN